MIVNQRQRRDREIKVVEEIGNIFTKPIILPDANMYKLQNEQIKKKKLNEKNN